MKKTTQDWMNFAKLDLDTAEKILDDEHLSNIALFHCQQTIEKIFKAILEENNIKIPKTHNIIKLYSLVPVEITNVLNFDISDLEDFDDIYIDSRYPSDIGLLPNGLPDYEDVKTYLKLTKEIFDKCIEILMPNANQ